MDREQLIERLRYFLNPENGIGAVLYFVLDHEGETIIRLADITDDVKPELKKRFLEYINDKFIDNEELQYQNISDADDRKNVAYRYDIEDKPESLNILNEIIDNENQTIFQFNQDSFGDLQGYLITIGNERNKIALYKKHHPLNLFKRDKRFLIMQSEHRFVKVTNDILVLDSSFDFMLVDENLIVLKLNILEKYFGFEDVVRKQAQNTLSHIETKEFLEDIEQLIEFAENMTNARKLMKIRNSPVLNIPVGNVITFIRNHPELTGKIGLNDDGTKIKLDTIASKKLFLKLLNDDYLYSQLTALLYNSLAKDKINAGQA